MMQDADKVAEFIELRSPQERRGRVCTRAARCYERGETVSIYAPDPEEAAELDALLWTFSQQAFIPHVRIEEADDSLIEPVVIFGGEPGDVESDVLLLASAEEMPAWFEGFRHIYDFAPVYDEGLKEAARRRYGACQAAGYRMRFIKA